jgi:drug/metabolite transporter (DMT)-like permease
MLQLGIFLAAGSALLCGCGDVCASQGAKQVGVVRATFLALLMGTLVLALMGALAFERLGLSGRALLLSLPLGLVAGAMTSIGYSAGYKGMAQGPLAIVSPVVASDGAIAGVLAILLLHERVDAWQAGTLVAIFAGVLLASTSVKELSLLLHCGERKALSVRGVHWGMLAGLAFGTMLFALGAGAQAWGWYLSLFWSRCVATSVLGVIVGQKWLRDGWRQRHAAKGLRAAGRSHLRAGGYLALGGGICETVGLALFSMGTQIASTSIVAMIASTFTLIPLVFGVLRLGERPAANQWLGVGLVVIGLVLLGIKPA